MDQTLDPTIDPTLTPLPGDPQPAARLAEMIRVDHAGEYGAVRIYAGQLAVLGRSEQAPLLRHMLAQEQNHLATFNELIATRRVRPTALLPLWHIAGYALGALTAALGPRAAMACTVAVEETIDAHYAAQSASLPPEETTLAATIETFRLEELEHRDTALAHEAEQTPFYQALTTLIKTGCRVAIAVSEKI
jgi:ubiquinone biosynthesis monooxygenase Coq7